MEIKPKYPFEKLAVELRGRIYEGELAVGLPLPSVKELARAHGMSPSTAQRAVQLLSQWGLVRIEPGMPTLVAPRTAESSVVPAEAPSQATVPVIAQQSLDLEVRRLGISVATLRTQADPGDSESLHRLLIGAVKRQGCQPSEGRRLRTDRSCSWRPSGARNVRSCRTLTVFTERRPGSRPPAKRAGEPR